MSTRRKSISKSLRFEIFDRDGFTCQYCGCQPPNVVLVIDHIIPVSKGGTNDSENLRTSCNDCNAGKSDKDLGKHVNPVDGLRRLQEAMELIHVAEEFAAAQTAREELRQNIVNFMCDKLYINEVSDRNVTGILRSIQEFGVSNTMDWFESSVHKIGTGKHNAEKKVMMYFYGILRAQRELLEDDDVSGN